MPEITVDDVTCYYRTAKRTPENAPAVICVHGSGGDGLVWSYQLSRLRKSYRVILTDLPGHGRSGGKPCYSVEAYSRWLNRFADSMGLASFFLMGHSFGGGIVQLYAHMYPEKVRGLILAATGRRFVLSRAYVAELGCEHEGGESSPEIMAQAETVLSRLYGSEYAALAKNGVDVLHADILAAGRFDSTAWIRELAVPCLVICGGRDTIMPPDTSRDLADHLPDSRFRLLPEAGHTVMLDAAKGFNAAVKEFMDSISNQPQASIPARAG